MHQAKRIVTSILIAVLAVSGVAAIEIVSAGQAIAGPKDCC
jgi:hypothetical protein